MTTEEMEDALSAFPITRRLLKQPTVMGRDRAIELHQELAALHQKISRNAFLDVIHESHADIARELLAYASGFTALNDEEFLNRQQQRGK